jgi:acyl-CoA thioester hydrolase
VAELQGYPVVIRFPLQWGEMDALGHANNVRYFAWFESARIAYFTRMGLSLDPNLNIGPILASTSCDFLKPLAYPAELVVGSRVSQVGTTSFHMEYAVAQVGRPVDICARGHGVLVMVNYRTGEKVPLTDQLKARIVSIEAGET